MTLLDLPTETPPARLTRDQSRPVRVQRQVRHLRRSRLLLRAVNVLLIAVCSFTAIVTVGNLAGFWRTDTVLTGSMRPGIQPGDVEILRSEPANELRVGQIVAFHPPNDHFTVTHRVIALTRSHGLWITTKGDANNVSDPWGKVRIMDSNVWVVKGVVPKVGFLSVWVRTPLPHLILVLTIVMMVCAIAIEAIWRT
jgi:signal peptidase I